MLELKFSRNLGRKKSDGKIALSPVFSSKYKTNSRIPLTTAISTIAR